MSLRYRSLSYKASVLPTSPICLIVLSEETETCSLGVGYKQIVPSSRHLLELIIPIFVVEPLHQRVRLCQGNEATCPDNIIAMASVSVDAYTL
ncbi:uncharacterized protein CC84DRAFT_1158755 [Paraphaeosphaeria sporulosa]|uniref:Uncharacterized protein n=1 Tax=Paraphaeosphaeria sporulosa TaxID=1460663 RepID=A0A177CUC3_9PLEO|nr:uncharacterized protein CC84DRAFT_1158755 [Paraphaeosphaeria sporulosa]OAG11134.1 hypothetical protein CC84DRAFT_1158755 [Paraphaeosphaeria sporulosa]